MLDSVEIAFNRFAGYCDVALMAKLTTDAAPRIYDPDDLLLNLDEAQFESVLRSGHHMDDESFKKSRIITHGARSTGNLAELTWFVRPARGSDAYEIFRVWLDVISGIFFNLWEVSVVATRESKMALEQIQSSVVPILESFVRADYRGRHHRELQYPLPQALDTIRRISIGLEEGRRPTGTLVFQENPDPKICKFEQPISITDAKHTCKLLSMAGETSALVSDGTHLVGITSKEDSAEHVITVYFRQGRAVVTRYELGVCTVVDGVFRAYEETLSQLIMEELSANFSHELLATAVSITEMAVSERIGCSIVLDPRDPPTVLSGHLLESPLPPADKQLLLGMASIDGAVQIDRKGSLIAFGCLLDGMSTGRDEVRSRGSRYNSARRFVMQKGNEEMGVIIVSSDGPVSFFAEGREKFSDPWYRPAKELKPRLALLPWRTESDFRRDRKAKREST